MNWKEDIMKFNLPHAKILYMIYYFFKSGELSYQQKFKLKGIIILYNILEYVILENERIFEILGEFEDSRDEFKLLEDLRKIYNEEIKYTFQNIDFPSNTDDASNVPPATEEEEHNISRSKRAKAHLSVNTQKSFLKNPPKAPQPDEGEVFILL
jgi:hypothetical protein